MATIADLIVKISADTSDFRKELNASKRQLKKALGSETLETSKTAAVGISALTAAAVAGGVAAVKLAGDYQQVEAALTNMLGSADKAKSLISDLQSFAATTPFEFTGVTKATQKLLAFGFTAEQIIPTLKAVGDAAAGVGGGQEAIDHITLAIGQMAAKNQVQAQEMMQLTEQGIPAWKMLADYLKTDVAGAMDMVEKRQVDAATGISALIQGMNNQYGGMMEQQSSTINGTFSNMMDGLEQSATQTGLAIADALNLTSVFSSIGDAMSGFAKDVASSGIREALNNLIPPGVQLAIVMLAGAITGAMVPALISMGIAAAGALVPLLPYIAAGAAVGAALYIIYDAVMALSDALDDSDSSISEFLDWLDQIPGPVDLIGEAVDSLADLMGVDFNDMAQNAETWANNLILSIEDAASGFLDMAYSSLPDWAQQSLSVIGDMVDTAIDWLTDLANFARSVLSEVKANLALADKYARGEMPDGEEGEVDTSGNNAADFYVLDQQSVQDMAPPSKKHIYAQPYGGGDHSAVPDYSNFRTSRSGDDGAGGSGRGGSGGRSGGSGRVPKGRAAKDLNKETSALEAFHQAVSEAKASGDMEALKALLTPENASLLKNEKAMDDTYKDWSDKVLGIEKKVTEEKTKEQIFRESLDDAYKENSLAKFTSLMTDENAAMMSAYNERQTIMQDFYNAWQAAHMSTEQMIANAVEASTQTFADFFTNLLTGAESFGDAFYDLITGVFDNIIKQVATKWANQITQKLFGTLIDKNNQKEVASARAAAAAEAAKSGAMAANATAAVIAAMPFMVYGAGALVAGQMATAKGAATALGALQLASGGLVSGPGTRTSDSIPAMLSDGEFVMNAEAVKTVGLQNLMDMNDGKPIHLAGGGPVGTVTPTSIGQLPTKEKTVSSNAEGGAAQNVTFQIQAMDAATFREFLERGGGAEIRQMLFDTERNFAAETGVW